MEKKQSTPDFTLFAVTLILVAFGLVMVFSSSAIISQVQRDDTYFFLRRQAFWAVLGIIGMYVTSKINYWKWKLLATPIIIINFILLLAVFIPGLGVQVYGAERWLGIAGLTIQPSEFTKIALVIFVATYLTSRKNSVQDIRTLMVALGAMGISCGLILLQPDMGTAVAVAGSALLIIFVAGMKISHMLVLGCAIVPATIALVFSEDYRRKRFLSFLDPWEDQLESGYQIIQSLYALGPGGLIGAGLGRSRQKFFYLPEPHNDFIFAVIGEELGFLGASLVIILFFVFIWRGFKIAMHSPDMFGALMATGITAMVGLQAFMNIGVVTASMPVTGINLPLISAGGSSLLFTLSSIGILLNISKHNQI
ncbi:stage V sporulation protein E [Natranaerobius thermophilus]|uniref:Probable peptidoglycan glycosyltransferase FtsW n=1 Tax=Natranaerobius thermophilus (strain ATCC BAA-1301 / DSM 18059 / JW/NM-WN-LF) TaxID=457570 RepID=B2A2H1_NATTJ|nr:stage V sporulation protein E [Natranaerobius thermophilus]ACB84886.1 cell division protein FtsW [Natranaerobius thermophilus JW/NM-WN-LF]